MNEPNFEEEYKNLEKSSDLKIKNLKYISDKIIAFQTSMAILKDVLIAVPKLSDTPFIFLDELFQNFIKSLEQNVALMKDIILSPLNNIMNTFKKGVNENLNKLNNLQISIIEEKKNLVAKKEKYLNYSNNNKNFKDRVSKVKNNNDNLDEKIFNKAMKENYVQLYNYELNKMNEVLEENNNELIMIRTDFKALIASSVMMLKESLTKFSNIAKNFGDIFFILSSEIKDKLNNTEKLNSTEILKDIATNTQVNQLRVRRDIKDRVSYRSELSSFIDINKTKEDINNSDNQIYLENENYINEVINELIQNEEEVKSKSISKLFNIIETEDILENQNYAKFILEKIKKESKDVIFIKNYKNFNHIANIINDLHLNNKTNINIFYLIIGVSQMIRYNNNYLYNIIRKKNIYFTKKLLWTKLIDESLIKKINKFINDIISKKEEIKEEKDKDKDKESNKKENLKNYLKKKELEKILKEYRKLNKNQKKELNKLTTKSLIHNLGKIIPFMYCFIQNQSIIEDIINDYKKDFDLNEKQILYLENLIKIRNKINNKNISYGKKDFVLNNKIIIAHVLKYLPLNDYPNILKLNKQMNFSLKNNIYFYAFSYLKLPINLNIKFWYICLKISQLKKVYNYELIKNSLNMSICQDRNQIKSIGIIQQDLKRTLFVTQKQKNYNAIKSILNCFVLALPEIEYCQGMNFITAILYQLLDENEELTFYYLLGLELNTRHGEIFADEFYTLNIYFNTFNTILNFFFPEIYHRLLNENIEPNCYTSSWFITLFTEYLKIIDKDNPPSLLIFIFNRFIFEGWSAIFNLGLVILEISYDKIMKYKKDKLISFMINIINEEKLFEEENFEKIKLLYLKNTKFINGNFVDILIDIKKFEYYNK